MNINQITVPITDVATLWQEASFNDPDGHHLIVYHAGKNRLDPPWRLP